MFVRAFPKKIETHPKYGLCHFMGLCQHRVKKGKEKARRSMYGKFTFLCCVGWDTRSSQQRTLPLSTSGGHMLRHSKETINWSSHSVQLGYSQVPELVDIRKWQFEQVWVLSVGWVCTWEIQRRLNLGDECTHWYVLHKWIYSLCIYLFTYFAVLGLTPTARYMLLDAYS